MDVIKKLRWGFLFIFLLDYVFGRNPALICFLNVSAVIHLKLDMNKVK